MRVIIDRFEGEMAVCERVNRTIINILRSRLPSGAKEGDSLIIEEDTVLIDNARTAARQKTIKKKMDDLWRD